MDLLAFEATKANFDRGAPRWREALWVVIKNLFFLNAWPWPSAWRCCLLRLFGASIGQGVVIRSRVNISFPWRLVVGDYSWIGDEVVLLNLASIHIGSHCCVSQRSFLCTGSHDFRAPAFDLITAPIHIHDHSWIAAACFIAPGVTVGPHAMATAGSIVTRDVAPSTIVSGNPARVNQQGRSDESLS
jgi:putative colanic acid biosynthesis acetyltransferase WcaF